VVNPDGGIFLDTFVLKAIVPTVKSTLPKLPMEGPSPAAAGKGSRPVYWPAKGDFLSTPIYSFEQLRPGNMLAGPAVVEGEYTTLVVPEPMRFSIDEHGLGILE
jgi:N-methylhydantoinase A/acetophenone carboxylase